MAGRHLMLAGIAAFALAGCTTVSRLASYGTDLADAHVSVAGKGYVVYVHPRDDTLLVQRRTVAGIGQSLAQGATFGAARFTEAKPYWRAAGKAVLDDAGCAVKDVYELDSRAWEVAFTCPAGVDIRAIARERRQAWRDGLTGTAPY